MNLFLIKILIKRLNFKENNIYDVGSNTFLTASFGPSFRISFIQQTN